MKKLAHNVCDHVENVDRWAFDVLYLGPGESYSDTPTGTHYVMAVDCVIDMSDSVKPEGMFFSNFAFQTSNPYTVTAVKKGSAVIVRYHGLRYSDQKLFVSNRLSDGNQTYMDGGTNTTAIEPGRLGEPVVNYVRFPPHMTQTKHIHPSQRIAICIRGEGQIFCGDNTKITIKEGEGFFMERNLMHQFVTLNEECILFVWAPDSGSGPTDEINQLKVRTYVV